MEEYEETYEETVEVTEEVTTVETVIQIRSNVPVQVKRSRVEVRAVVDLKPIEDETGAPVLDATGVPITYPVPRTKSVSKTRSVSRQKTDESGNPLFIMNVRYSELAMLLEAARRSA
jgi:hypothetical protein